MSDPNYMIDLNGIPINQVTSPTSNPVQKDVMQEKPEDVYISNMNELRDKAPELWDKTLKSIANNILGQMRRSSDRLKQLLRKNLRGQQ